MTCLDSATRRQGFESSLHWKLSGVARELVGLDYADDVIKTLQCDYPSLRLVAGRIEDATTLFAGVEPFELVVLGDILEHLDNAGAALDAIHGMATPGGEILVSCPNAFGGPNILRFAVGRFEEGEDHVASYNKFTLANLLARHGFAVQGVWTALDRPPAGGMRRVAYRVLGAGLHLVPELGGTLVVLARRT